MLPYLRYVYYVTLFDSMLYQVLLVQNTLAKTFPVALTFVSEVPVSSDSAVIYKHKYSVTLCINKHLKKKCGSKTQAVYRIVHVRKTLNYG